MYFGWVLICFTLDRVHLIHKRAKEWIIKFLQVNHSRVQLSLYLWIKPYQRLLYDQTNFGTVKHNCCLLGHRVSRNTRETRCCTNAWRLRIYNTPVGPVTSTCVSQCWTIMCQIIDVSLCDRNDLILSFGFLLAYLKLTISKTNYLTYFCCMHTSISATANLFCKFILSEIPVFIVVPPLYISAKSKLIQNTLLKIILKNQYKIEHRKDSENYEKCIFQTY